MKHILVLPILYSRIIARTKSGFQVSDAKLYTLRQPQGSRGTGEWAALPPCPWFWALTPRLPFWPFTAVQFGQLLTHLDATQQMIACSLKDNAALLTQVSAPLWSAASPPRRAQARPASLSSRASRLGPCGGTVVRQEFGVSLHTVSQLP